MKTLERSLKKEIIKRGLESLKTPVDTASDMFFVSFTSKNESDEFEKKFIKLLPKITNDILIEKELDPSKYNRSITYSIQDKNNKLIIQY
jgi:predicted RNA-binding protein Jag